MTDDFVIFTQLGFGRENMNDQNQAVTDIHIYFSEVGGIVFVHLL